VTETAPAKNQIEEYSLPKLLALHLLPAGAMLLFYIPLARIASENGIPTMFVLAVLFTLILVPFELGWLYYQGKKLNGTLSLQGVVCYREKMPWWQYLAFGLGTFAWVVLIFFSSTSLMDYLDTHLFAWIPDWFKLSRGSAQQHGPAIESTMWILGLIIIAIIGPLSEELYFRGYLLPSGLSATPAHSTWEMGSPGERFTVHPLSFLAAAGFCNRDRGYVAPGVYRMVEAECLSDHRFAHIHQYIWLGKRSGSKTRVLLNRPVKPEVPAQEQLRGLEEEEELGGVGALPAS
jgi:membrane protease YdiL (CAAX protease family)